MTLRDNTLSELQLPGEMGLLMRQCLRLNKTKHMKFLGPTVVNIGLLASYHDFMHLSLPSLFTSFLVFKLIIPSHVPLLLPETTPKASSDRVTPVLRTRHGSLLPTQLCPTSAPWP